MGVSGCGKTTVGQLLAEQLHLPFYDADDFHPASNVAKMKAGIPLQDEDREPWLRNLANNIARWSKGGGAVLACSALKEKYRQTLASKTDHIKWVYLHGTFELIQARMEARNNHYMPPRLLQSQFDALEIPDYAYQIDISEPAQAIVNTIITKLKNT